MARGLIARPCRRLGVQFNSCRSLLGSRSDSGPLLPSLQHHLVFSPSSLHASWIYYFISVESKASKMDPLDRASIYPGTSFDERRSSIGKKWSRDPRPLSVFAPPDHSWASDRLAPGSFATMFRDLTCTVRSPTSSNLRAAYEVQVTATCPHVRTDGVAILAKTVNIVNMGRPKSFFVPHFSPFIR
ncbi:hypothetical protein BC827DRAFT_174431 [Russula dissimulans]|nr:hypothetical protein BC827DRAFT_174431 [Russula dissimulans]